MDNLDKPRYSNKKDEGSPVPSYVIIGAIVGGAMGKHYISKSSDFMLGMIALGLLYKWYRRRLALRSLQRWRQQNPQQEHQEQPREQPIAALSIKDIVNEYMPVTKFGSIPHKYSQNK